MPNSRAIPFRVTPNSSSKGYLRVFFGLLIIVATVFAVASNTGWPLVASLLAAIYYEICSFRDMQEANADYQLTSIGKAWNGMQPKSNSE